MVDTGASGTCVDPSVLSQLNLSPTGQTQINTPSTGAQATAAYQYDVSLLIMTTQDQAPFFRPAMPVIGAPFFRPAMPVIGSELVVQGFHVPIGRDILRHCLLTYDGQSGLFSLAY